jgi:hypothetical protein
VSRGHAAAAFVGLIGLAAACRPNVGPSIVSSAPHDRPVVGAAESAPPAPARATVEQEMCSDLYKDAAFRQTVCLDNPCTLATFCDGLDYDHEVLRPSPLVTGYFVEPKRVAENMYIGFFTLADGGHPKPHFTFFGSGLGVDKKSPPKGGFRALLGAERDGDSWINTTFEWNGQTYVQSQNRTYGPGP